MGGGTIGQRAGDGACAADHEFRTRQDRLDKDIHRALAGAHVARIGHAIALLAGTDAVREEHIPSGLDRDQPRLAVGERFAGRTQDRAPRGGGGGPPNPPPKPPPPPPPPPPQPPPIQPAESTPSVPITAFAPALAAVTETVRTNGGEGQRGGGGPPFFPLAGGLESVDAFENIGVAGSWV